MMMIRRTLFSLIATFVVLFASAALAQAQTVTGSGTANTIPKWTGSTTLGNSSIRESLGNVFIGGTPTSSIKFGVISNASSAGIRSNNTGSGDGVSGDSASGVGVRGSSTSVSGVVGSSGSTSLNSAGVFAIS